MTRLKTALFAVIIAGMCLAPSAQAVQLNLTCENAVLALQSGNDTLEGTVVGVAIGAAGMIGDLLCFIGDRRCNCLRNVTDGDRSENDDFSRELGSILDVCRTSAPGRSLSGIAQEAARDVCP